MTDFRDAIRETLQGCIAREDDPEYARRRAELEAQSAAVLRQERQRARREALVRSGVPEATWAYLDAPQGTPALLAARQFLESDLRFFTVAGPGDTGKTVTLAWLVAQAGGLYVTAAGIVKASTFDRGYWAELEAARLLAIDEMGAEKGNPEFDQNLYELLDARFRRCRKTALGSNLGPAEFKARYCEGGLKRLYRRLKEHGVFQPVTHRKAGTEC